jgi:putative membrane protein
VKQNRVVATLSIICAAFWLVTAFHPVDRQAWVLENILVVLFALMLVLTHRRLQLSNASWLFLALFLILHMIGAHYTYAKIPLGLWAKDFFGFSRNHFDRVAHFGFGFFLAYPVRELLRRFSGISRGWSFWITAGIILAVSGFFEILESIVAEIVAPGQGVNWLGGQGDEWDAQNDMLSAMLGALVMMGIVALITRKKEREQKVEPAPKIDNRSLRTAVGIYIAFWIVLAIKPLDRGDWFLENLLIFISVGVLALTYRRFQFSNVSYALILIFLAFHTIGAHYTYAKVPAGFWMQHWLHLSRNHYDRVIHFGFGFLLLYPMTEVFVRSARVKENWAPWLAASALWALSSFFEILEAVVAMIVRPELGAAYLGTQGDIWDAQKDMGCAFAGALLIATWLTIRQAGGRKMEFARD